jgi:curved DNA-binding protein CbpA
MKDYYTILEVNRNASIDEIKKQYKILARKFHPDKGGDENKFKEISEAFQILSDPQKKSEYDNPLVMKINLKKYLKHFKFSLIHKKNQNMIILLKLVLYHLHMIYSLKLL